MSCSMTVSAVQDRSKTVTRRHVDTWTKLAVGDRLTLIEKGMGLPKGAQQVVLAEVEIVSVRVEPVWCICAEIDGTVREGLGRMTSVQFVRFWMNGHGYKLVPDAQTPTDGPMCRRIEWEYL